MKKSILIQAFSCRKALAEYTKAITKSTSVRSAVGWLSSEKGRLAFEKRLKDWKSPLSIEDCLEVLRTDLKRRKEQKPRKKS